MDQFLLQILGTGVVAGIVVVLLEGLRDWLVVGARKRRLQALQAFKLSNQLLAMSLFASKCLALHSLEKEFGDASGKHLTIPEIDYLNANEIYGALDNSTLSKLAEFDLRSRVDQFHADFGWRAWMNQDDSMEYDEERLESIRKETKNLAVDIRRDFALPKFNFEKIGVEGNLKETSKQ